MAGYRDGSVSFTDLYHHREWQIDPTEIKLPGQFLGHAKNQNVAVLRFHFTAFQDDQALFLGECGIVRFKVMLTMFGQHKAVYG